MNSNVIPTVNTEHNYTITNTEIKNLETESIIKNKNKNSNTALNKVKQDHTFKIVLIGDSGVGKSCILLRFADDQFNENFYATIGVDFRFKNLQIDGKNIRLQIWDTAGQERFKTITSAYYRGADGICIVYDITDRNSFIHLRDWLDDVNRLSTDDPIKLIIANKCDLEHKKEVFDSDIKSFEEQTGIDVVTVSAKESIKINEVMENITKKLLERKEKSQNNLRGLYQNSVQKLNGDENKVKETNLNNCC